METITKIWLVFLYFNADNSLSEVVSKDIEEILNARFSNLYVLMLVDYLNKGAYLYQVKDGFLQLIEDKGEIDMGNPQTLVEFIEEGKEFYPAKKYALVLWNHGNGWREELKAVSKDRSSGNSIGVAGGELQEAFSEIKKVLEKEIDLVVFDACAMGITEVAYELRKYAEVMIASESLFVAEGIPYDVFLETIDENAQKDSKSIASEIIKNIGKYYQRVGCFQYISAIQISKVKDIAEGVEELKKLQREVLINARKNTKSFSVESGYPDYIDFLDFSLKTGSMKIKESLKEIIIESYPEGGIGLWFPTNYLNFKYQYNEYRNLDWNKDVDWVGFLSWFYALDDVPPLMEDSVAGTVKNNSVLLTWKEAYDFSLKGYEIFEAKNMHEFLSPDFRKNWDIQGFEVVGDSMLSCYNSGYAMLNIPLPASTFIRFDFFSFISESYNPKDMHLQKDGFYIEISEDKIHWDKVDSITFKSEGWEVKELILKRELPFYLRFAYEKKLPYEGGINIKNLSIDTLDISSVIFVKNNRFEFFNKKRGEYLYFIRAVDNGGLRSNFISTRVWVENYAIPYTVPSPFKEEAELILDYPGNKAWVFIYSISGKLIYKKRITDGKKRIKLPGREFEEGVYLVVLTTPTLSLKSKIVKIN